jgi:ketosteroid isomerase-like protein
MSQENVALARQGYEAMNEGFRTGRFTTLERFFDPEVVLVQSGVLPDSGKMRGYEGLLRFISRQAEAFDEFRAEPKAFIDAGDKVVVPLRVGGRARYTGLQVHFDLVHVLTGRDGKCTRLEIYLTESEALEAVGLAR